MNRFYNIYMVGGWGDVLSGPSCSIPLCKVHGKEVKQLLKRKWYENASGFHVFNGNHVNLACEFCGKPMEFQRSNARYHDRCRVRAWRSKR